MIALKTLPCLATALVLAGAPAALADTYETKCKNGSVVRFKIKRKEQANTEDSAVQDGSTGDEDGATDGSVEFDIGDRNTIEWMVVCRIKADDVKSYSRLRFDDEDDDGIDLPAAIAIPALDVLEGPEPLVRIVDVPLLLEENVEYFVGQELTVVAGAVEFGAAITCSVGAGLPDDPADALEMLGDPEAVADLPPFTGLCEIDSFDDAVHQFCSGDTNGDGMIGVQDLAAVVLAWGSADPAADLNGDGTVGVDDLVLVIVLWGSCP